MKRLARTGKFANIDASIRAKTNNLRLTLKSFALSPELNKLRVSVEVTGGASADVSLKFIPLDIVGHLACQAPWTENQTFEAHLRDSLLSVSSDLQFVTDGINAGLRFEVPGSTVPLHLEPSPTEFFIKSVNMTIACQGLNLVKPLALTLTPFIPELRGDLDYKYNKQKGTIALTVPSQTLGALEVNGTIKDSAKAFFLFGSLAAAK